MAGVVAEAIRRGEGWRQLTRFEVMLDCPVLHKETSVAMLVSAVSVSLFMSMVDCP